MTVSNLSAGRLLSKKALAAEFGIARDTVSRILKDVPPSDKRNGYPVWQLSAVSGPLADYSRYGRYPGDTHDVTAMSSKERKDWYDSERLRLQVEREMGKLVPAEEFRTVLGDIFKIIKVVLITLPDQLELEVGMSPYQIIATEKTCHRMLDSLAEKVAEERADKQTEVDDDE